MKRNEFLKRLAIGTGVAVVTPSVLKGVEVKSGEKACIAIDVCSLDEIYAGGHGLTPAEIIDLYHETGVLIYKSRDMLGRANQPPMVFTGELEVVDITKIRDKTR